MFASAVMRLITIPIFFLLLFAINIQAQANLQNSSPIGAGKPLNAKFPAPTGFTRPKTNPGTFAAFLRRLPLRPGLNPVKNYRGQIFKKATDSTVAAVVNLDIRQKKLEQCMDVLQRLYAEFLIAAGRFDEIKFQMPDKSVLAWTDWRNGWRPRRDGGHFPLKKIATEDGSRDNFECYLREIFYYSGTQTAYFGLKMIPPQQIAIGDMLIKRGRRGHAVMIVDLAINDAGEKIAIFMQGDTPASEPYILKNKAGSPWFPLDFSAPAPKLPIAKTMTWDGLRRF